MSTLLLRSREWSIDSFAFHSNAAESREARMKAGNYAGSNISTLLRNSTADLGFTYQGHAESRKDSRLATKLHQRAQVESCPQ
jgi:hypothetical protein